MGEEKSKRAIEDSSPVDVVARELERRRKTNAAATADLKHRRPPPLTFPCRGVEATRLFDEELGGL